MESTILDSFSVHLATKDIFEKLALLNPLKRLAFEKTSRMMTEFPRQLQFRIRDVCRSPTHRTDILFIFSI